MQRVGILYQPRRQESANLAEEAVRWLSARGVVVWRGSADDDAALSDQAATLDLLITVGGDGTIVRAVRAVAHSAVPILGVNLGRLGFLAEVEPADLLAALERVLSGPVHVEERAMLRLEARRDETVLLEAEAINDLFVGRGTVSRTVRVSVEVDGHYVMTQTADGVIVSTPTGSTAYCLAAGGPIVAPDVDCLIVTPVAAHLSLARSVVIAGSHRVCLRLIEGHGAILTVDGHLDLEVGAGDVISCTTSANKARFLRFGGAGYFYETVLRRLRWPDQGPIP